MKFSKKFLCSICGDPAYEISHQIIGTSRWSIEYRRVFLFDKKFYETNYQVGATEYQDEGPYECEDGDIECAEVVPVEKAVIEYVRKESV